MVAVNNRTFVRLTPDGSGKRVKFKHSTDIQYINKTGSFTIGDTVVGGTSGQEARIIKDLSDGLVANAGVISCVLTAGYELGTFTTGEDLLVNAVKQGEVEANSYCKYVSTTNLVGHSNPDHGQEIDGRGAGFVRFTEGSPQFDAFGRMQISQAETTGQYIQSYDELPSDFSDTTSGGATLTYNNNVRGSTLSCTTISGDLYRRTSNRYHIYQAGVSQIIEMTVASGDEGKDDVNRQWGYYDDKNGFYFKQTGTSFGIGLRSFSTGSIVETNVAQVDWNADVLDGTDSVNNPSGVLLDTSKDNIYWFDMQWLGAGTVRFGVIVNGERLVCHELRYANQETASYMSTGSLPISYEIENTATSASGSDLKFFCSTVKLEGKPNQVLVNHGDIFSITNPTTTRTPIVAFRQKQLFKTFDNRSHFEFISVSMFNGTDKPIEFRVSDNGTLAAGAWSDHNTALSSTELYTGGTISGDHGVKYFVVPAGGESTHIFATSLISFRDADITQSGHITVTGAALGGTATGDITVAANWTEVRD